jgi:hypothetical protein
MPASLRWGPTTALALLAAALLPGLPSARAQYLPPAEVAVPVIPVGPEGQPPDLTPENLFTTGWCEGFQARPTDGRAERVLLFRTRTPFLDRAALLNYEFGLRTRPDDVNEQQFGAELLLPVNRRLMFDVATAYNFNGTNRPDTGGAAGSVTGVLQLLDTPCSALNVQLGLGVPGRDDLLPHRLNLDVGTAGIQDLGQGFAVQGSLAFDFPLGSSEFGSNVALSYAVALTKTLTDDLPWLGRFTPFVELAGTTELGVDTRRTFVTILPGAEWELARSCWVAAGLEVPLTGPRPFDLGLHLSLRKSF